LSFVSIEGFNMRLLRNFLPRPIRAPLRQFAKGIHGNVAVTFAFAAVPMMIMVGSAVDYSTILNAQSQLQNAADTAALSIAPDAANLSASAISAKAEAIVTASMANSELASVTIAATYDPSRFRTTVIANGSLPMRFLTLIGKSTMNLGRTSVAQAEVMNQTQVVTRKKQWPVCVMVTAPSSNHSLFASGVATGSNASTISLQDCMLQVNTGNWDAVETDHPNAKIIGNNSEFCFHGGYIHNVAKHGTVTTTVAGVMPQNTYPLPAGAKASEIASPGVWDSGCLVFDDKLESKTSPLANDACSSGARTINGTTTLSPGRYCGNMTISNGTVTFAPGNYQIDGTLTITGGTVVANGVLLYLNGAGVSFDMSGGTVTLSPSMDASAGDLAGVALYVNNTTARTGCVATDGNPKAKSAPPAACANAISGGRLTYSGVAYFRYLAFWVSGSAQVVGNGAALVAEYVATLDYSSLTIKGIANAATAAQLALMQDSQAGYTTTSSVTTKTQGAASLIQ
jgi:Flp pilus assembly protein TadG